VPTAIPRDTTKPIASRSPTNLASAPSRAPLPAKPGAANAAARPVIRSRFRALHRLWKHPLGEVHGGTDATTGARVLVTALHAGPMIQDRVLEAAQQLVRETAALSSPFIAKPVDVQRLADGRVGVATEALEGAPLTNVSRNQPLPASRVYAMLRQVCRALAVTHARGIVHRGMSLGSIILRARAERPDAIVLTDFGIGALLDADLAVHKEDAALQPVAPERISGQERDAREDMYLLGCIAYTLLTGGAPFRTGTPDAVRRRHAIEDPMPITDRLRGARSIPVALASWVHRCLAKEPDDRFENVAELEAALCFAQIEDHVQTAWDDLPLPDVDASRRERIFSGLQARPGGRPTIDDQITTVHTAEFGEDDDGDKTIVRAPNAGNIAPLRAVDDQSRSIVLEQDAAILRAATAATRGRHEDTVDVPAPRSHEDTVDAPPPTEETAVVPEPRDDTQVGETGDGEETVVGPEPEPHDETVVGGAHDETFVGRDAPPAIDRRDTLLADQHELDEGSDDTFVADQPGDATWGGPAETADVTLAGPPRPPLPSEQDTIRGPAPAAPNETPQLHAVRPPMPAPAPAAAPPVEVAPAPPAPAVPAVVADEEDSLGDLQTRISQLPPVRDGNTVVAPAPAPPAPVVVAPPPAPPPPVVVAQPPAPPPPVVLAPPPDVVAPAPMMPAPAPMMPAPPPMMPAPAPMMPAPAPAPNAAWGLPPPTLDTASIPGATPAAWGPSPVEADMSMIGSADFGRTRRLVGFAVAMVVFVGIIVVIAMGNRETPPPPPPEAPAQPAVTVTPTTPVRPRDPAFDTAQTAAEFAVAGERALAQKRLEDAEELFQAAIVRDPKHIGALLGLGNMRAAVNDWPKASAYYQRAVNAAPKDGTARLALGDALVKQGKVKDARREYKKAKQLGHPDAAARLAQL
jgi:hypothetical protein